MAGFIPTVNFNAAAVAAGSGVTPAGVQMALSAADIDVCIELTVAVTSRGNRVSASDIGPDQNRRRQFTLWAAFSAQNLAGAQLNNPAIAQYLAGLAFPIQLVMRDDLQVGIATQSKQERLPVKGPYLYLWYETGTSPDAYTVTVTTTEITTH